MNGVNLRNTSREAVRATPAQLTKTNSSTTVPVALSAAATPFQDALIGGFKSPRTVNTGSVYIGPTSTNGEQPIEIAAGAWYSLVALTGQKMDFTAWYLDVLNANDGVVVVYTY